MQGYKPRLSRLFSLFQSGAIKWQLPSEGTPVKQPDAVKQEAAIAKRNRRSSRNLADAGMPQGDLL